MSLLVRAALLGGLAYVVSRAVRSSSQQSLDFSRSPAKGLPNKANDDVSELQPPEAQPSTSNI